jgi:DNA polymerase
MTVSAVRTPVPANHDLGVLRQAVAGCRGCSLWQRATQAVFGEGPARAPLMLVGEQPGDQEDRHGEPFVGPAGRVLDQALEQAGIDRDAVYVTNAVKHFKWEERGKRRLHKKPNAVEVAACRPWLEAEIDSVQPEVIVGLGATAAQSLLGGAVRVTRDRGHPIESDQRQVVLTVHPSAILRIQEPLERRAGMDGLVADLTTAWELVSH